MWPTLPASLCAARADTQGKRIRGSGRSVPIVSPHHRAELDCALSTLVRSSVSLGRPSCLIEAFETGRRASSTTCRNSRRKHATSQAASIPMSTDGGRCVVILDRHAGHNDRSFFARFELAGLVCVVWPGVRVKIAKTKTLDAGDVNPLKDDLAGGGFVSKEMIGIIFNHARDTRTAPTRLPLGARAHPCLR